MNHGYVAGQSIHSRELSVARQAWEPARRLMNFACMLCEVVSPCELFAALSTEEATLLQHTEGAGITLLELIILMLNHSPKCGICQQYPMTLHKG